MKTRHLILAVLLFGAIFIKIRFHRLNDTERQVDERDSERDSRVSIAAPFNVVKQEESEEAILLEKENSPFDAKTIMDRVREARDKEERDRKLVDELKAFVEESPELESQDAQNKAALLIGMWFWLVDDPHEVANWIVSQGDKAGMQEAHRRFVSTWAHFDSRATTEWIKSLTPGRLRDAMVDIAIHQVIRKKDKGFEDARDLNDLERVTEGDHDTLIWSYGRWQTRQE